MQLVPLSIWNIGKRQTIQLCVCVRVFFLADTPLRSSPHLVEGVK